MLKSYDELKQVDITRYCEERDGFVYLNWAKCIDLLREHGAEKVFFEPIPDEKTGSSLRMTEQIFVDSKGNTNRCYETRIRVVIDDQEYEMQSPVMNGSNPVKDNSMSQQRVWNSMCRSFVKCVAIHTGLGFNLWLKEEMQPFAGILPKESEKPNKASLETVKNLCLKHKINFEHWISNDGKNETTLTADDVGRMLNTLKERFGDN